MDDNTAKIRRVDQPQMEPILVSLDHLRSCPERVAGDYSPTGRNRGKVTKNSTEVTPPPYHNQAPVEPRSAPKTVAAEGRDGGEVTMDEVVPDTCPSEPVDQARTTHGLRRDSFICSVGRASPGASHSNEIPVQGQPGLSGGGDINSELCELCTFICYFCAHVYVVS